MPSLSFNADFQKFDAALAEAVGSLKDFEVSAKGVQGQLTRMAQGFAGAEIKRQAEIAAAAVERVGGASKLTEAEQRKVNATVTEALAKYRALGQDAPDHLSKLAKATEQNEKAFNGLRGAVATAVGTFAGFVSAQAVIGGISSAFKAVAGAAIDMNSSLEKTTLQFTTLMGDAGKARDHVKSLFEFAKATPFETGPIIEASKQLQVFGGEALNTKENLTLIGDAAAATGAPINEVGMWVGRLYANLAAGRPIGEAAQRLTELAVIGPQARAQLEAVATSGKAVEDKFRVMQDALSQFTGAMAAQAATWEGVTSTLKDTINLTVADAFRGLFEVARDTMGRIAGVLGSDEVSRALSDLQSAIGGLFGRETQDQVEGLTTTVLDFGSAAIGVAEGMIVTLKGVKAFADTTVELAARAISLAQNARAYLRESSGPGTLWYYATGGFLSTSGEDNRQVREGAEWLKAFADSMSEYAAASREAAGESSKVLEALERLRGALRQGATAAKEYAEGQEKAQAALDRSKVSTEGLVTGVENFGRALQGSAAGAGKLTAEAKAAAKAVDDLTGRSKVAAMQEQAKAIERAGGFSKVLASEYGRVNKVFSEGIEAAEHLGLTLPQAFVNIARATQDWHKELGKVLDTLTLIKHGMLPGDPNKQIQPPLPDVPGFLSPSEWGTILSPAIGPRATWVPAPNQAFLNEAAAIWKDFTRGIATSLSDMLVGLRSWKDGLKDLWQSALTAVSDIIAAGIGKIINSLGQKLFNLMGPGGIAALGGGVGAFMVGRTQGTALGALSGIGAGAAIGSMLPGIGTAIGAAVGGLVGALGGILGPSRGAIRGREADARIGQTQQQLLQQFGSLDAIRSMGPAGAALADAWGSRNVQGEAWFSARVEDFRAQQERVTALLGEQSRLEDEILAKEQERARLVESLVVSYADVQRIGSTYKLDLEGLGVAIGQMGTTASFTTIINDLDTLARAARQAGGELDWGGALYGMREEIGALVASALRMGTEVPANMRPFIENLFETGNLLDENEKKITDISELRWGAPVETEAEKTQRAIEEIGGVIDTLKTALLEVVGALTTLLPAAAREAAAGVDAAFSGVSPTVRVRVEVDGEVSVDGVPHLADGAVVRRRTLAVIGEAGPEAVVPLTGDALRSVIPTAERMVGELRWRGRSIADVFWREARPSAVALGVVG